MMTVTKLFENIDADGDCWEWTGAVQGSGYGRHREVWQALVGEIPEGLELDHLCKNKMCVNPDHLEPIDVATNRRRAVGSTERRCKNGHYDNWYVRSNGKRRCNTCHAERVKRWRNRA